MGKRTSNSISTLHHLPYQDGDKAEALLSTQQHVTEQIKQQSRTRRLANAPAESALRGMLYSDMTNKNVRLCPVVPAPVTGGGGDAVLEEEVKREDCACIRHWMRHCQPLSNTAMLVALCYTNRREWTQKANKLGLKLW